MPKWPHVSSTTGQTLVGSCTLSEYFPSSVQIYYLILLTAHITAVYQMHRLPSRDVESSFSVGLRLKGLKNCDSDSRVKGGHRLLNLCYCDSGLSKRCRQTKKFSRFATWSQQVGPLYYTKFKLLVYVQSICTKIIWHCNKYTYI